MLGMAMNSKDTFLTVLKDFRKAEKAMFALITDPQGERYFQSKSVEVRLREFEEQIERMQAFMEYIGNPECQFPAVHVAGTSGKGSVVNMIAGILSSAGLKVGFHVSPYLQVCNEKLIVDGKMIAPSEYIGLVKLFQEHYRVWQNSQDDYVSLKYGEGWVALTFLWMAQQKVDWAVIETGLGGRYDPTNIVPSKLAVITNVDYDHTEVLGETLGEIASHKAGIIKPEGLAITGETKPEVLRVFEQEAERKKACLLRVGKDYEYELKISGGETYLKMKTHHQEYDDIRVAMKGRFQGENAALAVASVDLLTAEYGVPITRDAIRRGLAEVVYPGRFEIMQTQPTVILDGAHNRHKAHAFVESVQKVYPNKKMIVVLGTLTIKDFNGIIHALAPITKRWWATQPHVFGKPAATPAALAEVIAKVTPDVPVEQAENVKLALDLVIKSAKADDIVIVTGSLYMLGDARERWYPAEKILRELEYGLQSR